MNELQALLSSLSPEHYAVAVRVINIFADELVMLEGRTAKLEARMREFERERTDVIALLNDHERRIAALEQGMVVDVTLDDYVPIGAA